MNNDNRRYHVVFRSPLRRNSYDRYVLADSTEEAREKAKRIRATFPNPEEWNFTIQAPSR